MNSEEKFYVRCKILKGIFSHEYFVNVKDFYDSLHRDFADKSNVKIDREPLDNESLEGYLSCYIFKEDKDKYLIALQTESMSRLWVEKNKITSFLGALSQAD